VAGASTEFSTQSNSGSLTCYCGKAALYRVGEAGYCKAHRLESVRANAEVVKAHEGRLAEIRRVYARDREDRAKRRSLLGVARDRRYTLDVVVATDHRVDRRYE
jgi:hypothetical protein